MDQPLKRIDGYHALDDAQGCYWKDDRGVWLLYLPFCGIGNLTNHKVEEHEDGTITVSPSIKITAHHAKIRHGYIERGVWKPCGDDNS